MLTVPVMCEIKFYMRSWPAQSRVSTQHVGRKSHVITVGVAGTRHAHNGTDCPMLRHGVLHQVLQQHKVRRVQ
jgi:hypothetical protein